MQPLIRRYATLIQRALVRGADDEFAKKLVQYLKKRGHLTLLPAIMARVERLTLKRRAATVVLGKAGDAKTFATSIASALTTLGIQEDDYQVVVDERVVGGFGVLGKGKVIDRTYRTALVSLYQKIISPV